MAVKRPNPDKAADAVTRFAGSLACVYAHAAWFTLWMALNLVFPFDPFPFGLLTMIVSLEAIFLSTFVMVSQNRQAAHSEARAEADYETNVRAQVWARHIGRALGLDPDAVEAEVFKVLADREDTLNQPPT